jgi:serine/threonine protein kinase
MTGDDAVSRMFQEHLSKKGFVVRFQDLKLEKKIAAGGSGQVYRGTYSGATVAVKELFSNLMDPENISEFKQEAIMLSGLHHPYVMEFFGVSYDNGHLYLVTKFYTGALAKVLSSAGYNARLFWSFSEQISQGMSYLHSKNIIHRDLKPDNVLVDSDQVKICDFGLAKSHDSDSLMTGQLGTPAYMAPEMMKSSKAHYSYKVDIFAYGVMLWQMYTKKMPYMSMNPYQIISAVVHENVRPELDKSIPEELANLMERCWHVDPDQRPDFDEVTAIITHLAKQFGEDELPANIGTIAICEPISLSKIDTEVTSLSKVPIAVASDDTLDSSSK